MSKSVACVLLLVACTSSGDDRVILPAPQSTAAPSSPATAATPPVAPPPAEPAVAPPAALPVAPPAAPPVAPPAASPAPPVASPSQWRDRVKTDVATLAASSPERLAELTRLAPTKTRAGYVRFTSDAIHDPRAASVFLQRLSRGGEPEGVRAALVEALPRTGGVYADAAVELFAAEASASVRAAYVHVARRAPETHAIALMSRGLADRDAEVQAEAARSAASHPAGKRLAPELRAALASTSPEVRAETARTLGILKIAEARGELVARLSDSAADVRLEALRAIDRIEPAYVHSLPLATLAKDDDPRVVALVTRLTVPPRAK